MIDFVVVALVVLLVIRGWMRGLVREAIDVGTLVLGALLAFRLAPTAGRLLSDVTSLSPDPARVIGGVVLFVAITVGATVVGSVIHRSIKHLPGLTTLNRIGGAALGAVYAAVLVAIAATLLSAAPLPSAVADEVDQSHVIAYVVEPDSVAQEAIGLMSGDRALQSMIWIRGAVDAWTIDPRITDVTLPGADADGSVHASTDTAVFLYEEINRDRVNAGLEPLTWSDSMSLVAVTRGLDVYHSGSFEAATPIEDRLVGVGVSPSDSEEYLLLAPTPDGLAEAANAGEGFTAVGVGVVDGPLGLMAVIVLTS
ncbi:MAG: CvpA family protein [Actinomycetota bacterium]|nr:CvpA family protein [Actinomycetota bacterium]